MDCIFCKIIKGEIPSSKVYEDESFIAILDISPANKGHTLVIPKEHIETFLDADTDMAAALNRVAHDVAEAVVKTTGCDGYNLLINNKKSSGQLVPHLHLHIIPRYEDDGIKLEWTHKKYEEEEMIKYLNDIKNNI